LTKRYNCKSKCVIHGSNRVLVAVRKLTTSCAFSRNLNQNFEFWMFVCVFVAVSAFVLFVTMVSFGDCSRTVLAFFAPGNDVNDGSS
jgi:hypothetical protein